MPTWYLTPAALGYLSQFILALLIAGYFIARLLRPRASRPAHFGLLTGFFVCVALLTLLLALEAATSPSERLYFLFPQTTVLALGIVLLLQFAYHFPEPISHKWETRLVLALSLAYLLLEAGYAVYRFHLLAAWGQVIFRPPWADYPMVLGLFWAPVVLLRQAVAATVAAKSSGLADGQVGPVASARHPFGPTHENVMLSGSVKSDVLQRDSSEASFASFRTGSPGDDTRDSSLGSRRGALWPVDPLRVTARGISRTNPLGFLPHLIHPQGQAAAARALALVYLAVFGLSLLNIFRSFYFLPPELYQLILSLGVMAALAAFAVIYLNALPETTSFMVRLVGVAVVSLLTVLSAVGWLITPAYAEQYHPAFPDQRTLRFTPNSVGGYDVSLTPFHFERDLGVNLGLRDTLTAAERTAGEQSARLAFTFPFYGGAYDAVYVNHDGAIGIGRNVRSHNIYPDYAYRYGSYTPFLFPLLLDLIPEAGAESSGVYARQEADRLIVTWERVPAFRRREAVFTFQAILYRSGVFEFSYDGLPAELAYRPDDEPSANVWVIGATQGTSPPTPLSSTSSELALSAAKGQALPGEGSLTPPSLAGKHVLSAAEGGVGGLGPQYVDFGSLATGGSLSGGPQGMLQDYYLDFRRHLHTLLLPLAYLIVAVSVLAVVGFSSIFHHNLVRSLDALLAGVRRVNAGDLGTTMPIRYHDEIGFLTESFNSAAARLHDQVSTLETRVAERTQALRTEMAIREAVQAQVLGQQRALAAAEERERLGRELHDGLGQVMGYVNMQAQAIRALLQSGQTDPAVSVARQLEQVAQDAHADVRAYILGIRTDAAVPAAGFLAALRLYLDALERAYGFRVTLDLPPSLEINSGMGLFTPQVEAQLLHIIQEGLTNVRKHAGVDAARVSLALEARQAEIVIADEGVGFGIWDWGLGAGESPIPLRGTQAVPSPQSPPPNHFGLAMMAERARAVGGSVDVASAPGQGTTVTVRMPLALAAEAPTKGLRVLLADDHPLFLDGLRNMLTAHGMNVVGLARDGIEAQEQAAAVQPDLILLDIQMPRCDGLEAARRIKAALPDTTIVMLTVSATEESLFGALKAGASGYILKSASSELFFDTLSSLLRGEVVFSPEVAALILADFAPAAKKAPEPKVLPGLTERQTAVLRLVARGLTYKEVGARLHIAEITVKYHMGEILNHLQVQTRKEAVAYAVRGGVTG